MNRRRLVTWSRSAWGCPGKDAAVTGDARAIKVRWGCFAIVLLLMLGHGHAMAAQCMDVFGDDTGVNENLVSRGATLDLSNVSWANNNWPSSGSTLSGGDYFFRGATLGNGYRLYIADGAQVRIFVNGSLSTGNNIRLNDGGDAGRFLLVTQGSLALGNNADVTGLIYAAGAISVGNNLDATGSFAAGGDISPGNPDVDFDDSGVDNGLLVGLCDYGSDGQVVLSANDVADGPVTVGIGEEVALSAVASDCPDDPPGYILRGWRDTWLIDGVVVSQETYVGVSACDRSPITRTEVFPDEGLREVVFQTEYIDCLFGLFCSGWQSHGQDSIQIDAQDADALTCFNDAFQGGTLAPDDWVTSISSGAFQPGIVSNGRLRMTQAVSNQATAATLQREIPGAENLVVLEFDYYAYGGNGADGLAFVLSDANFTPRPGSYGGSLGYAQRGGGNTGFAGGWIGIGLDEYGNFSNPSEGRVGGPGFRRDAIAIRGAAPDYRYLEGTQTLNPGVDTPNSNNPSPQRYRITVDSRIPGQALVSVERDTTGTGNNYQELIAPFNALAKAGQPAVPESFLLSMTGSTGGSNNIHEFDNFQLCALKLNPVGPQIHHFELVHDGSALTCQPEPVLIRACADAECSETVNGPVKARMEPEGWGNGDVVTFSGGSTVAELQVTTPTPSSEPLKLGVEGSEPPTRPQADTLCRRGNSELSAANCNLTFADSGLAFTVPPLVAGKTSEAFGLAAVKKDDVTQECVPAFSDVTRDVAFWSSYSEPNANRSASPPVSVNETQVGRNEAQAQTLTLDFNSDGVAQIDVRYPDAGLLMLDAKYEGAQSNGDQGLVMLGKSSFSSRPAGFCIESPHLSASCDAPMANCSIVTAAGDLFPLSVRAVAWQAAGETGVDFCQGNSTTQNFRFDLTLDHALVAPASGQEGSLGQASASFREADDGDREVSQSVSEVGVFSFSVPPDQNYYGQSLPGGTSAPIGRFTPAHFEITSDASGRLKAADDSCSSFSYIGQSFGWDLLPTVDIFPRNRQGETTRNYLLGDFDKLDLSGVAMAYPASDNEQQLAGSASLFPVTYAANMASLTDGVGGQKSYWVSNSDTLTYSKVAGSRVQPFDPALTLSVSSVRDTDGVTASNTVFSIQPEVPFELRYGRLVMENVYGPETAAALKMPFHLEYWSDNARFDPHAADNCTSLSTSGVSAASLTAGEPVHHTLDNAGTFKVASGEAAPLVLRPTDDGTDRLTWQLPVWLQDDWSGDSTLDNPSGLATFGVYRGHDRVIYWREL